MSSPQMPTVGAGSSQFSRRFPRPPRVPSLTNAACRAVIKTIDPHRWEAAGEPWYGHYGGEATGGGTLDCALKVGRFMIA